MKERMGAISRRCRRGKRGKCSLIRNLRSIADPLVILAPFARRCGRDVAKCLKWQGVWSRVANVVSGELTPRDYSAAAARRGGWPCAPTIRAAASRALNRLERTKM